MPFTSAALRLRGAPDGDCPYAAAAALRARRPGSSGNAREAGATSRRPAEISTRRISTSNSNQTVAPACAAYRQVGALL